jgi:uncharacterized protein (TIGR00297 family)
MLLMALLAAIFVAGAAFAVRVLTVSGAVSAAVMGTIVFGIGGWPAAAALLTFFGTSSLLSRWRKRSKDALGFEKTGRRDAVQVWANGGVAAVCVLLPVLHVGVSWSRAHLMFLAALAAANADTWATEIGAAVGGVPFSLTTGKRAARGTSGAVSVAGLLAACLGAALLGAFAGSLTGLWVVTVAGWGGALFDSLLGATAQAQWQDADGRWTERPQTTPPQRGVRWMNNDAVNAACTILAVGLAALLSWG